MEQKYNAPIEKVFALLTDPKWLEARSLALGELSAKVKAKKSSGGGVTLSMTRRVKRELPALVAKVLPSESDLQFEETWIPAEGGWDGTLTMVIAGQPVTLNAEFTLEAAGKSCIYRIEHEAKCSIPLVGGAVAKFAQGQVEKGCADEFKYLAEQLKRLKSPIATP
jgi:uncharacterized protein YndB with AHSA1/START domain